MGGKPSAPRGISMCGGREGAEGTVFFGRVLVIRHWPQCVQMQEGENESILCLNTDGSTDK